VSNFAATEGEL